VSDIIIIVAIIAVAGVTIFSIRAVIETSRRLDAFKAERAKRPTEPAASQNWTIERKGWSFSAHGNIDPKEVLRDIEASLTRSKAQSDRALADTFKRIGDEARAARKAN